MKRLTSLLILFLGITTLAFAQEKETEENFKPSGKIILRSFFDYSKGFGHVNDESGFDLTRAFIGYNYRFTRTLQARVVIDGAAGRTSDKKLDIYVRNAYINWQDYGFDISLGEVNLLQYDLQDAYWKHRYIMSFQQDFAQMGYSVDLGAIVKYKINDMFSTDFTIMNGEGYKNISKDNSMRYSLGLTTYLPHNFVFRAYADMYNDSKKMRPDATTLDPNDKFRHQYNIGLFAGYKGKIITAGLEYNRMFNKAFVAHKNVHGMSAYTSVQMSKKWEIFGRYDYTNSHTPDGYADGWNQCDNQLMVFGVQYQPFPFLKLSPNFRNKNPRSGKSEQYAFFNVEFNLP